MKFCPECEGKVWATYMFNADGTLKIPNVAEVCRKCKGEKVIRDPKIDSENLSNKLEELRKQIIEVTATMVQSECDTAAIAAMLNVRDEIEVAHAYLTDKSYKQV